MKKEWQLQNAKNKFSEVVNNALTEGPQLVTKSGKPAVYIISAKTFDKLRNKSKQTIKNLLLHSPLRGVAIDLERKQEYLKDLSL